MNDYEARQEARRERLEGAAKRKARTMRGRLTWEAEFARYYLWDRPVHAGDAVELHAPGLGRWIGGRIETDDSGRVAYFHHTDDALPWPGVILLAVRLRQCEEPYTALARTVSAYPELRWPER